MDDLKKEIRLLTVSDLEEITGYSTCTVMKMMSQPDLNVIKIRKENQVLLESFK